MGAVLDYAVPLPLGRDFVRRLAEQREALLRRGMGDETKGFESPFVVRFDCESGM